MKINDFNFDPKTIEPCEQSPLVSTLLSVIEKLTAQLSQQAEVLASQAEALARQTEKIDALINEIRQLKKLSKKPKLSASNLPKDPDNKDDAPPGAGDSKRPGSSKRNKNKNLKIDKEEVIGLENVPSGSVRKGYQSYIIQDLIIKAVVTKYRLIVGNYLMEVISLQRYPRN